MDLTVFSTGSLGNCAVIDDTLVIDAGYYSPAVGGCAVLLTHSHSDHASKLRKYEGLPIYATHETIDALAARYPYTQFSQLDDDNIIFGYRVRLVRLLHDVPCVGFDIARNNARILYATDFARIETPVNLRDYTAIFIECNNTLCAGDLLDRYARNDADILHARRAYETHCNAGYLYELFRANGFNARNRCKVPVTLLHKSKAYYNTHPEQIERLSELISNIY